MNFKGFSHDSVVTIQPMGKDWPNMRQRGLPYRKPQKGRQKEQKENDEDRYISTLPELKPPPGKEKNQESGDTEQQTPPHIEITV
jgi:hypothetical protein